jgi:hypothetical protein
MDAAIKCGYLAQTVATKSGPLVNVFDGMVQQSMHSGIFFWKRNDQRECRA